MTKYKLEVKTIAGIFTIECPTYDQALTHFLMLRTKFGPELWKVDLHTITTLLDRAS